MSDHACKNFSRDLMKLAKSHPEIGKFAVRASRAMMAIIKKADGNAIIFKEEVNKKVNHYCGEHNLCGTSCRKSEQIFSITAQEAFKVREIIKTNNQSIFYK